MRAIPSLYTALLMAILPFGGMAAEECAHSHSSDIIGKMCAAGARECARVSGREINERITDGCLEHLGFRIFPDEVRGTAVNPAVADFVERYWLSLTLPLERQKSVRQQMSEDRFTFIDGDISSIDRIQKNPELPFNFRSTDRIIAMSWGDPSKPEVYISFPVDYELILGRGMLENDRRLPAEIRLTKVGESQHPSSGEANDVTSESGAPGTLQIYCEGSYIDCALKSDRYMIDGGADGPSIPLFDTDYPAESLSNLFTGTDLPQASDIALSIRHKTFGLSEQRIETNVAQFVTYCLNNGCTPYVGIVGTDRGENPTVDMLVIMRNRQVGYNHVLRVSVPAFCIQTGTGKATARLNAFIPSSNIKNLFKD